MFTNEEAFRGLPKFPIGLKEAPISRISLGKLLAKAAEESARLFTACETYGFFYMDLTDSPEGEKLLKQSDEVLELAKLAFALPFDEKDAVSQAKTGNIFGFKAAGVVAAADKHKRRDQGEMWNLSKNDLLRESSKIGYPEAIMKHRALVQSFNENAHDVGMNVMELLAGHLGIPPGELSKRHRFTAESGDHTRLTWGPGSNEPAPQTEAETKITTYAHTDFGSVTLLFNWLGGLQIENRHTGEWEWVRPLPGHAIYNMGDAMVEFSGGRLASGKHRVLAAPGEQGMLERYSIVYFVRPEDEVYLDDLTPSGKHASPEEPRYKAAEWISMKAKGMGNRFSEDKEKGG